MCGALPPLPIHHDGCLGTETSVFFTMAIQNDRHLSIETVQVLQQMQTWIVFSWEKFALILIPLFTPSSTPYTTKNGTNWSKHHTTRSNKNMKIKLLKQPTMKVLQENSSLREDDFSQRWQVWPKRELQSSSYCMHELKKESRMARWCTAL